ncbi:MAG: asparaginase [Candidatus Marinimicrobia bacterium]|jgi:L-asparaginase II|nr:asparaginase [Candidatus Neomarinimicrobiota bacterium]MBT4361772.1 asparaginase [Candidatus Neomarinimicrobiota bacterium]MBT4714472.1 asparaginase [Candidatus Neomarinimicrobiota bacterium]MBT4946173.1 asparaginase [Candidatus Neomarinimicrobiota bacterium]MBT5268972.1 asparaginase [Candidatus Neomarinimicrobiota bacterium]
MKSLITQVTRSGVVESFHVGYGVIVDTAGKIVRAYGDTEYLTYVRSSAKPLQGMAVLRSGAYDDFKLTSEELAVICSSHSGEPVHTETVSQIFSKAGLGPELLACGIHPPIHRESAKALQAAGIAPQQIHNNCSGKHAGMLATSVQLGYSPKDYLNPDHPVQQYIYDIVKEYTSSDKIHRGVDGCSAPVFHLPLQKVAMAFARISQQANQECRQIFQAMTSHPHLVAGEGRFDTALMESYPSKIMSKGGAEAVSAAGFIMPDGQVYGLAVKVLDGNYRAIGQMVLKMLEDIGFLKEPLSNQLMKWWKPELKNHAKHVIGTTKTLIAE